MRCTVLDLYGSILSIPGPMPFKRGAAAALVDHIADPFQMSIPSGTEFFYNFQCGELRMPLQDSSNLNSRDCSFIDAPSDHSV